jgi:thiamine biosynthesis lipoprotein
VIKRILFTVCITVACITAYTACTPQFEIHSRKLEILGTTAEVTISKVPKEKALDAITDAKADLQAFDKIGYTFEEDCELNRLNEALANGDAFKASDELLDLIRMSQKLSNKSEGLFNPAAGELTALWEYHCTSDPCPESPYPDEVMKLVEEKDKSVLKHNPRMSDININGNTISSSNRYVKLEFGDVIRGFAMDKVIERLKDMDIENAMIDIGPSVRIVGKKDEHPWWVGLYDATGKHIIGTIELSDDSAVVTARALTKSSSEKGAIYRHIVYPDTGLPIKDISSVTVVHESAAVADVAATALMIAGIDSWKSVASNMNVTAILLFTSDGTIYLSPAMSHMINWKTEISHKFLRP